MPDSADWVLIAVRTSCAAVLMAFALAKLPDVNLRRTQAYWRPPGVSVEQARVFLAGAVIAELGSAAVIGSGIVNGWVAALIASGLAVLLTAYGIGSIRRRGSCGCGGPLLSAEERVSRLLLRNCVLFGLLASTGYWAPGAGEAAGAAAVAGLVPAAALAVVVAGRAIQARSRGPSATAARRRVARVIG